jgi:hypothetical protein
MSGRSVPIGVAPEPSAQRPAALTSLGFGGCGQLRNVDWLLKHYANGSVSGLMLAGVPKIELRTASDVSHAEALAGAPILVKKRGCSPVRLSRQDSELKAVNGKNVSDHSNGLLKTKTWIQPDTVAQPIRSPKLPPFHLKSAAALDNALATLNYPGSHHMQTRADLVAEPHHYWGNARFSITARQKTHAII